MSALEPGWASKSGRTFLFRGAEALAGLILILAVIMLGSLIRGVSIDPWKIFDWCFRPEYRKVGDIAWYGTSDGQRVDMWRNGTVKWRGDDRESKLTNWYHNGLGQQIP